MSKDGVPALTKAQRAYLAETSGMSLGYSVDVLTGPETAMVRRLIAMGYIVKEWFPRHMEHHYQITDLGRAALEEGRAS